MEYAESRDLLCYWNKWEVVLPTQLAVHVKPGNCTDMTGAIRIGKLLMPAVQEIAVFSGTYIDIVYRVDGEGKWWAYDDGRKSGGIVV